MRSSLKRSVVVGFLYAVLGTAVVHARPIPTGMGTTTVSYMTHHSLESFSGNRNYSGTGPASATPLGAAPNIAAFNSVNSFGRRQLADNAFPNANVINDQSESLVTNAFFKINNNGDYFPDLEHDSNVTIKVENMTFSEPVTVLQNTFMFHTFWLSSQSDQIPPAETYLNLHNHHTAVVNFRDLEEFEMSGVFAHGGGHGHGGENAGFGDVHPHITGDGTAGNPLSIELTVPYHLFASFEQVDQAVPAGLPGPQGFLEPFHFHLEYVVVPEPATIGLLAVSALFVIVRRRRS